MKTTTFLILKKTPQIIKKYVNQNSITLFFSVTYFNLYFMSLLYVYTVAAFTTSIHLH